MVLGGRQRWRAERLQNSVRNRRPFRGFRRTAALARRASRILSVIDDLFVVLGGWRRWRVERPQNSVRNRRPFRGFGRVAMLAVRRRRPSRCSRCVAALVRGASSELFW